MLSLRVRIYVGFAVVLAILAAASAANWVMVNEIERHIGDLRKATSERVAGLDLDAQVLGLRVRVNQWLRSRNPEFAAKADALLAGLVPMAKQVAADAGPGKTQEIMQDLLASTAAYTTSWGVIKGLYAEETRLYDHAMVDAGGALRADLTRARTSEAARGAAAAVTALADAEGSIAEAEKFAWRFRSGTAAEDADRVAAALGALLADLHQVAAAVPSPETVDALTHAHADVGAWETLFAQARTLAKTRAARLITWTRDEGEPMGRQAAAVAAEGAARAAAVEAEQIAAIAKVRSFLTLITNTGLLIGLMSSWLVGRSITKPLARITQALKTLASGDRTGEIPETSRQDEIGDMARSAEVFKENAIAIERMAKDQEAAKQAAVTQQKAAMNQTADTFEAKVGNLVSMLSSGATELKTTAKAMSAAAAQTDHQASAVAAAAKDASTGVQTVAAAAEELTASIQEISRRVAESTRITEKAVGDARRTDAIVRALASGAQKIGDVVQMITRIAAQTNLLALNATIEAARAGDAGKGFAVVASEVKSLANQTSRATEEIGAQIAQIQSATEEAVKAIQAINATIGEVSNIATSISAAVEEQGAATAEIAQNVHKTANSTREVTTTITLVSQAANDTGSAAERVLGAASSFSQQAHEVTNEVRVFVAEIRTG